MEIVVSSVTQTDLYGFFFPAHLSIGNTSSNGGFSVGMLVFEGVIFP